MKRLFLLLCCFSYFFQVRAQQLIQERLYRVNSGNKSINSSLLTREGNIVFSNNLAVGSSTQSLIMLIKPNTDTLWIRKGQLLAYGGGDIRQTPRGGYVTYGTLKYSNPTTSGTSLQKLDINGIPKWNKNYPPNIFDLGYLLLSSPDSGYFLGGKNSINGVNSRFNLSRTDSLGNLKWRKHYDWSNYDFLSDMQFTRNGNIIMYGISSISVGQRLKLLIVNQNGDSILGRLLTIVGNINRNERTRTAYTSVTSLTDGGFLMAAEIDTSVASSPPELGMVVKVDANLQPVWHYIRRTLPNNVTFTRSRELTDGSMVMLGYERIGTNSTAGNKFFLYRFSATGSLLNIYTFTSSLATQIQAATLEALPDSSFIIGGSGVITPSPNTSVGFYVAKVKIAGLAPAVPLPVPTLITGTTKEQAAAGFTLGQSYPNPTTESAIIPFNLPNSYKQANILIRDITGRKVGSYQIKKNSSSLEVNLRNFSNWLYTYTLLVDEKPIATKKLSVIK